MNIHKIDSKLKFAIIIIIVVLFMFGLRNLGIYQVNKLYNQLLKIENINNKQSLYSSFVFKYCCIIGVNSAMIFLLCFL